MNNPSASDSMHGTVISTCSVSGLTLSETAYPSDLMLPKHAHQRAYFCFVLQGRFAEAYDRRSRECNQSTLVFHPQGEVHADCFRTAARCFNLEMDFDWTDRWQRYAPMLDCPADFRGGFLAQLALRLYGEFRQMDDVSPLVIEGLTLEISAEAFRHSRRDQTNTTPRWLNQARRFLDEQFSECHTLSEIAEYAHVHPTHLARAFRRYHGCTVGEYVRRRRIEFARDRISRSSAPLSQIALEAGFSQQSHFSTTFKRMTGMTPDEYRRHARAKGA